MGGINTLEQNRQEIMTLAVVCITGSTVIVGGLLWSFLN